MIMVSFTNSRVIHRHSMKPLLQIENSFDTQTYCCTANVNPILVPLKYVFAFVWFAVFDAQWPPYRELLAIFQ